MSAEADHSDKGALVCILAAGPGTRLGLAGGALHKGLAPLGNRAVLSRIIEQFPEDTRFVVAVGHLDHQIRAYLELSHGDRDIELVKVPRFSGPGSGPGLSLLACEGSLTEPFYLTAADSLVGSVSESRSRSWMGVASVKDPLSYLTVSVDDRSHITGLHERTGESSLAFVGIAWIKEPLLFLDGIRRDSPSGELQVTPGFDALIAADSPVDAIEVEWLDTGSPHGYNIARAKFDEEPAAGRDPVDVTYLFDDRVVKWFRDPESARRRVDRANVLESVLPRQLPAPSGWLAYERVDGTVMRGLFNGPETARFLAWAKANLWRELDRDDDFSQACTAFYRDKTFARLDEYLERKGSPEPLDLVINGIDTEPVKVALERELPGLIGAAVPSTFHGDLHEGNIVRTAKDFRLIDWRDAFDGDLVRGDRLYDLAKFLHTLELPESVMDEGSFHVGDDGKGGLVVIHADTPKRAEAREQFWSFCQGTDIEWQSIAVVDALTFVNMAPLYPERLGEYLYMFGRWLLNLAGRCASADERESALISLLSVDGASSRAS